MNLKRTVKRTGLVVLAATALPVLGATVAEASPAVPNLVPAVTLPTAPAPAFSVKLPAAPALGVPALSLKFRAPAASPAAGAPACFAGFCLG
ncbi:hypothetical protein [Gandjariella thermophila]|uniref:Secreted protein n=1 Tax=Gandjariella thermophila TaxID=1931992 RepID=A0A4D4J2I4_9PSEU|nr:hypothetical protein [Gandjariella thermophila]GDY28726.1 hypothetical protein GTS_03590 [Gandjariella thermophila]